MNAGPSPSPVAIIADDEEIGRLLLAQTASAAGLEPLAFANGADALAAALAHPVAIALLDVDMPGLDGYELCRRLRAEPGFSTVPIVMVTGHEDAEAIAGAFAAGATDFISKPVNWALLPRRLEYILRNAAAAERIERLAYYDTLTGLPNRQHCLDAAHRLFGEATACAERVAVICLDLNGFKRVNDTFGHAVGDAVMQRIAATLEASVAKVSIRSHKPLLARFASDEFVILARDTDAAPLARQIATSCADALRAPIAHGKLEFYAAPSIGFAVCPDDGVEVATVLKRADIAMEHAKAAGGAVAAYIPAMSGRRRDSLDLEARLRRAVAEDRLELHYQPKFRIADGRLVGVEALLRWCDPEHGEVPPPRFIEIAEESGLIVDLGAWVVGRACLQLRAWRDRGIEVPVAVNVSGKEWLHADPIRHLEREAVTCGIPASLIEMEITESLLVADSTRVHDALERLRALGCRIALDDFGTGYSSLAYITRFPPDRIKIDKTFVRDVDRSPRDAAVATAILSLGASLGMTVTAEGVERAGQLDWLRARGCDEVQGYLLSRPLPAAELERRFLESRSDTARAALAGQGD